MKTEGLVSVAGAAEWLSVGRTTVYDLMKSGQLPYVRVATQRRIDVADLRAYVQRQRAATSAPALRSVR